jgi:putative redox protein
MPETQPKTVVSLKWDDGLSFTATHKGLSWTLDADNEVGPSPVIALASALAGCMAIDVVHILLRGRHKVEALDAKFTGERADTEPKRFTKIDLLFTVETNASHEAVERAIEMSHEKYCSVWHSMRQDIAFHTGVEIRPLGDHSRS